MRFTPIAEHGIIGDLHTAALVGLDGAIDFLCFPSFASPTVFAALLDPERGGSFRISPATGEHRRHQLYLPDSNVLLTRFLSEQGVAEISDFMPVEDAGWAHNLVRRAKTVRGEVRFRMVCAPRFDYARAGHQIERRRDGVLFTSEGADGTALCLSSSVPLEVQEGDAIAEFTLAAGETAEFVLERAAAGDSPCSAPDYVAQAFKDTLNFWRRWVARSTYAGRWRETINRSALTLKLLVSQAHGSIVAAPTFGLPEIPGGSWNWDYRYTWIRDASFTLYALTRLGYTDEADRFMRWITERCGELVSGSSLQVMYGIDGRRELVEETLPHLVGYEGSRPVRIGNAAYRQLQLDIYGELMDAVYLYDKYGDPVSYQLWRELTRLVEWVCENWQRSDHGIWELREVEQEYLVSRLMCWVAVDRAIRLARKRSLPAPLARWHEVRDRIYREIHDAYWRPDLGAFVGYKGGEALDAATLLMPLVRFIGPTDRRWISTLRLIEERLVEDSLVYRLREAEEAKETEGTFSACSFWYVENVSRTGDLQKARLYFEKMLGYGNHLGLFSEELGARGEHLGNFPQALTHLALISAAYDLDRRLSDPLGRRRPPVAFDLKAGEGVKDGSR